MAFQSGIRQASLDKLSRALGGRSGGKKKRRAR